MADRTTDRDAADVELAAAARQSAEGAARQSAEVAARHAQVAIRPLTTVTEMHAAVSLFSEIWKTPDGCAELSPDLLQALALSGNYVSGAFGTRAPEQLLGAAVAFASVRPGSQPPELHSHVTGAMPGRLGSGIGFALKLHQRAWALEHGIGIVTWTFDPLVRRNAVFNLAKLGACATAYLPDVYGSLTDILNSGGESDRLWARWRLSDRAVVEAAGGSRQFVSNESLPCRLAPDENLKPRGATAGGGRRYTVSVPSDIEALRLRDPALAGEWRVAVREVLGRTLDRGGRILGVDKAGDFVLEDGAA